MINYSFSAEAVVQNQDGNWVGLFQAHTVAIRAVRTTFGPPQPEHNDYRPIISQERVIRIMAVGYLGKHGYPKDNPKELNRIETELKKQLDEGIETWMEAECPPG